MGYVNRLWAAMFLGMVMVGAAAGQATGPAGAGNQKATVEAAEPYTLAEGEVLKRVQPPFVEARLGIYQAVAGEQAKAIPGGATGMILQYEEGKLSYRGAIFYNGRGGGGYSLGSLISQLLKVPTRDIEGDAALLRRTIEGDFVVRKGATADALREALAKIVLEEGNGSIVLSEKLVEKPVKVLSGEWTGAVPNAEKSFLDVYGDIDLSDGETEVVGEGKGTVEELGRAIGSWIQKPVVVEATGGPPSVGWKIYNSRNEESRKKAHDAEAVLKHIEEQTGMKVSEGERKVPRIVVEEGR